MLLLATTRSSLLEQELVLALRLLVLPLELQPVLPAFSARLPSLLLAWLLLAQERLLAWLLASPQP
jgi:hypothetical protein